MGLSSKLKPIYSGPFLVVRVLSPVLYRIEGRKGSRVAHHDRLRICEDRVIPLWMRRKRHAFLNDGEADDEPIAAGADLLSDVPDWQSGNLFSDDVSVSHIPYIPTKVGNLKVQYSSRFAKPWI